MVLVYAQLTQLVEVFVDFLISRLVIDLGQLDPLDVELVEVFLLLSGYEASELVESVASSD